VRGGVAALPEVQLANAIPTARRKTAAAASWYIDERIRMENDSDRRPAVIRGPHIAVIR